MGGGYVYKQKVSCVRTSTHTHTQPLRTGQLYGQCFQTTAFAGKVYHMWHQRDLAIQTQYFSLAQLSSVSFVLKHNFLPSPSPSLKREVWICLPKPRATVQEVEDMWEPHQGRDQRGTRQLHMATVATVRTPLASLPLLS